MWRICDGRSFCGGSAERVDFEGYEEPHNANATGAWRVARFASAKKLVEAWNQRTPDGSHE
jgi:hypothetical protein